MRRLGRTGLLVSEVGLGGACPLCCPVAILLHFPLPSRGRGTGRFPRKAGPCGTLTLLKKAQCVELALQPASIITIIQHGDRPTPISLAQAKVPIVVGVAGDDRLGTA